MQAKGETIRPGWFRIFPAPRAQTQHHPQQQNIIYGLSEQNTYSFYFPTIQCMSNLQLGLDVSCEDVNKNLIVVLSFSSEPMWF